MFYKILTFLGIVVFLASSHAETSERPEIRFQRLQRSMIAVPVFINGHGPYNFLLDTGTETSLIDSRLAQGLGLVSSDRIMLRTSNGNRELARAFLPTLTLGSVTATNLEVLVDDLTSLSELSPKPQGLLGQDFFSQFGLLLDYKHGHIVLFSGHTFDAPIKGEHIPLKLLHGLPVLSSRTADGENLDLILDSGTSTLTLFQDQTSFRSKNLPENIGTLKTLTATSHATRGTLLTLVLGQKWLHNIMAFVVHKPDGAPTNGMLPTNLFSQVYIDNQDGYAILGNRLQ